MSENKKHRSCNTVSSYFSLLDSYPAFRENALKIEDFYRTCRSADIGDRSVIFKIPVVVHVVYYDQKDNISDRQIVSQLDILNNDYRAQNKDISLVPNEFKDNISDAGIEFHLAEEDPAGKITTGITRTKSRLKEFSSYRQEMKFTRNDGHDAWDTERYLNIWVCPLDGSLLGYAQFPGGPSDTDGVVIRTSSFGVDGDTKPPFNKGRTAVHEVGHYLNLSHIWGESRFANCQDDDYVSDTPTQRDQNYGKPKFPSISCNNGPHGDMFMNYMDYVDDEAMFMFTKGQTDRMRATLLGPRSKLVK